jgi:ABC-2 type transport system ATP-binding protein
MDAIKTHDLTKDFGSLLAVNKVTFNVKEGEIFGLLGPNGAGKTTTINMLTTLLKPTSGSAEVVGFDIEREANKVRNSIGLVPQDITVDEDLTGRENIMLISKLYHVPNEVAKKRSVEILGLVDLMDAADRKVETYSGGMRKRLELAEGLIHYPKVLFLDEPTLGLDVQTRSVIWAYIQRLRNEQNMTIFLTTHYMDEADRLCDIIGIIDNGRIVIIDNPKKLKESIGGDIIILNLADDSKDISRKLKALPLVTDVMKNGKSYTVKVLRGDEAIPNILKCVLEMNLEVTSVSQEKPSLDQVYLKYTGKSLRDNQASNTSEDAFRRRIQLRRARA